MVFDRKSSILFTTKNAAGLLEMILRYIAIQNILFQSIISKKNVHKTPFLKAASNRLNKRGVYV
jgi:prephenate dehydratase